MNFPLDETIWPQVSKHLWKHQPRIYPIKLIIIHSTRGDNTMELQYQATKNWQISPNNVGDRTDEGIPIWGSMSSRIISHEGQLCVSVPDDHYPTFSAGHMDPIGISYELAQPNPDWPNPNTPWPFTEACLERAAIEIVKDCLRFGIPPIVLPYVSGDNHEAPGIARHDRSANGSKWGKTDPGELFDNVAFEARVRYHMTKILSEPESLRVNKAMADVLGTDRDADRLVNILRWVFAAKGWRWPS